MRRVAATLLGLVVVVSAPASAQRPRPVRVEVQSIFGEGTLLPEGWVDVVVHVENVTSGALRGEVRLEVSDFSGASMRRVADLDLPPRSTRTLTLPVFTPNNGGEVRASFRAGRAELGAGATSISYAGGARSVVILDDPPRLRGGLLDLDVFDSVSAGARQVRVPVGVVSFEAESADPRLPTSALGYSTVKLVVASTPALARVGAPERAAIEDWLRVGGRLLVFPRAPSELDDEWLVSLAGRSTALMGEPVDDPLVAATTEPYALRCGNTQLRESFGCSRGVGRGRVYVASYDGMRASAIDTGAPRELVRSVYAATGGPAPVFPLGAGVDHAFSGAAFGPAGLRRVQALLDPNEGFRPALVLVALVLLLYVFVVGPINFRWVQRRGRPTLALLTTPAAAGACVLLLLAVGYVGKGVRMRYSRVELVEALEGEARGSARSYTGYFATRPGSYDLPGAADGLTRRLGATASQGPTHRHEGGSVVLSDIRTGLWETVFMREDRMVSLGGPIHFERDGPRLAAVANGSQRRLEGAFVVDTVGAAYPVGDLAPGARAPVPRSPRSSFRRSAVQPRQLAELMGEEEGELTDALFGLTGDEFVPREAPVLYARVPSEATAIGPFGVERAARWIRVAAGTDPIPLTAAPPPQADPYGAPPAAVVEDPDDAGAEPHDASAADAAIDGGAP